MVMSPMSLDLTIEVPLKSSSNSSHELLGLLYSLTLSPPTNLELHSISTPLTTLNLFQPMHLSHPFFLFRFKEIKLFRLERSVKGISQKQMALACAKEQRLIIAIDEWLREAYNERKKYLPTTLYNESFKRSRRPVKKKRKRFINLMHRKLDEVITLDDAEETPPKDSSTKSVIRKRTNPVSIFGNKRVTCFGHDKNKEDALPA
nr:hypothetical protein [Tanacetum cinerariifolium]